MHVMLNGEATELADGVTVGELLRELGVAPRRIAVEINRDILARDEYGRRALRDGDVIEIVHFIGGG